MRVLITQPQFNLNWISFEMTVDDNKIENNKNLFAYPNPTDDVFQISGINDKDLFEINIYDLTGRALLSSEINKVDLTSLPKGIYIARINIMGIIEELKIIKK